MIWEIQLRIVPRRSTELEKNRKLRSQALSGGLWEALELIPDQTSLCFLKEKGLAHPCPSVHWDLLLPFG